MELLLGILGKWLWPVVAGAAALLALFGFGRLKKREGRLEERTATAAEAKDRSLEAHREADRIKEEARAREKVAGDDPTRDYPGGVGPGGVRGPGGAGKP